MRDRANLVVETRPNQRLFLYKHWGGHCLPVTLQKSLQRKQRWDDPPYLVRILFCGMLGNLNDPTGYGIDTEMGDNSYDLLVVRPGKQVVELHEFDGEDGVHGNWESPIASWTFEEFCNLKDVSWDAISSGE